jgi:type VI secretion system secreted protein Hcp
MKRLSVVAGARWRLRVGLGLIVCASLVLSLSSRVFAIGVYFLDVPGIPGEAMFPPAAGQIDVLSFSTGVGPQKQPKASGQYGAVGLCAAPSSKPLLSAFCVVKNIDKASPKLFLAAAQGTNFATVTVSAYKIAGGVEGTTPYITYVLSNAIVASVQHSSLTASDATVPTETVCFNSDKVQVSVAPVDPAGGVGTPEVIGFDACLDLPF